MIIACVSKISEIATRVYHIFGVYVLVISGWRIAVRKKVGKVYKTEKVNIEKTA